MLGSGTSAESANLTYQNLHSAFTVGGTTTVSVGYTVDVVYTVLGVGRGMLVVMTVVKSTSGPGGVTVTTEILRLLVVLTLALVPLCAFDVPEVGLLLVLLVDLAEFWPIEVLEAVLVAGALPALARVGKGPTVLYTSLATDHHTASSKFSSMSYQSSWSFPQASAGANVYVLEASVALALHPTMSTIVSNLPIPTLR